MGIHGCQWLVFSVPTTLQRPKSMPTLSSPVSLLTYYTFLSLTKLPTLWVSDILFQLLYSSFISVTLFNSSFTAVFLNQRTLTTPLELPAPTPSPTIWVLWRMSFHKFIDSCSLDNFALIVFVNDCLLPHPQVFLALLTNVILEYDKLLKAPICSLGSFCDSNILLPRMNFDSIDGLEPNAPNTIDGYQ